MSTTGWLEHEVAVTGSSSWSGGRPELISFPSEDRAFAHEVATSVTRERPASPEELERALRPRFPRVVVHLRSLSDESHATWYVFRDGKVMPA